MGSLPCVGNLAPTLGRVRRDSGREHQLCRLPPGTWAGAALDNKRRYGPHAFTVTFVFVTRNRGAALTDCQTKSNTNARAPVSRNPAIHMPATERAAPEAKTLRRRGILFPTLSRKVLHCRILAQMTLLRGDDRGGDGWLPLALILHGRKAHAGHFQDREWRTAHARQNTVGQATGSRQAARHLWKDDRVWLRRKPMDTGHNGRQDFIILGSQCTFPRTARLRRSSLPLAQPETPTTGSGSGRLQLWRQWGAAGNRRQARAPDRKKVVRKAGPRSRSGGFQAPGGTGPLRPSAKKAP